LLSWRKKIERNNEGTLCSRAAAAILVKFTHFTAGADMCKHEALCGLLRW
jgi:hypothetical protein